MEGGLVAVLDSSMAIRLPSECIHAVLTLASGFLASKGYNTPQVLPSLSLWLSKSSANLSLLSSGEMDALLHRWIAAANLVTDDEAVAGWDLAALALQALVGNSSRPMRKRANNAMAFWRQRLETATRQRERGMVQQILLDLQEWSSTS